jgi:hypothetical protein
MKVGVLSGLNGAQKKSAITGAAVKKEIQEYSNDVLNLGLLRNHLVTAEVNLIEERLVSIFKLAGSKATSSASTKTETSHKNAGTSPQQTCQSLVQLQK